MALRRFDAYWNALGRRDPFSAILLPGSRQIPWDVDAFFATGRADALRFITDLTRIAPGAGRARGLDFGCGVGRITRTLADHFEAVDGVDVARSMIARARDLNRSHHRCQFHRIDTADLGAFSTASFDVVYSRLVLQHLTPPVASAYIREFLRVLKPGGALMFQLPTVVAVDPEQEYCDGPVNGGALKRRLPDVIVRLYRRFKYRVVLRHSLGRMEMFGVDRPSVESLIAAAGGRLLEVRPDQSHGTPHPGFEYWATRS
ncbi:MAG: methyltransferase domain-containing protein [Acidobacteriota bacterium]